MWVHWFFLCVWLLGAIIGLVLGVRVLNRGARKRSEFKQAIGFVCMGCTFVVMACWKVTRLTRLADHVLTWDELNHWELGTAFAFVCVGLIVTTVSTRLWQHRPATADDYADRENAGVVATEPEKDYPRPPTSGP
jgi:hypothetical protein